MFLFFRSRQPFRMDIALIFYIRFVFLTFLAILSRYFTAQRFFAQERNKSLESRMADGVALKSAGIGFNFLQQNIKIRPRHG